MRKRELTCNEDILIMEPNNRLTQQILDYNDSQSKPKLRQEISYVSRHYTYGFLKHNVCIGKMV